MSPIELPPWPRRSVAASSNSSRLKGRQGEAESLPQAAAAETERLVAWLRLPAIALIAAGEAASLSGVSQTSSSRPAFFVVIVVFSAWSAGLLAWVHLRPVGVSVSYLAIGVDVVAITVLAVLSGGAFSQARLAYFVIPIAVAFRFRPVVTAIASASTVVAYLAQALAHPSVSRPEAGRFIAVFAGYLAWVGLAAVLLAAVLARRTERIADLARARKRLMAEALAAGERERQALAEGLHDHAIQNLLSARHELEEAAEETRHPSVLRADDALTETISELREAIFELHPSVLDQAGLEVALPAVSQRAAQRGRFQTRFELRYVGRHAHERLLLAAARELLANVAQHSDASLVTIRLTADDDNVVLVVSDDGHGFDPEAALERLAEGHIGLASLRVRIETVGGEFTIHSAPDTGTTATVRIPM